jgi:hypothetical protein
MEEDTLEIIGQVLLAVVMFLGFLGSLYMVSSADNATLVSQPKEVMLFKSAAQIAPHNLISAKYTLPENFVLIMENDKIGVAKQGQKELAKVNPVFVNKAILPSLQEQIKEAKLSRGYLNISVKNE